MFDITEILLRVAYDGKPADDGLTALERRLKALDKSKATPKVDVNASAAQRTLNTIKAKLDALDKRTATASVNADDGTTEGKLDRVLAKLADIDHTKATAKVDIDTSKADAKLTGLLGRLQGVSGKGGLPAALLGGGLLSSATGGLSSLAGAVGGAGALGVGLAGAAAAFGVLGVAVKQVLTDQGNYAKQILAVHATQLKLNAAQNAGATSTLKIAAAQQALAKAQASGNQYAIATAQAHLALVQATAQAQTSGNQQLVAALRDQLSIQKAGLDAYDNTAAKVRASFASLQDDFKTALGPAVKQVLQGMLSALGSLDKALPLLTRPMLTLGTAFKNALSSPATQAGIRSLVDGFGKMAAASAPLVGPLLKAFINLGEIFLNIARATMPELVRLTSEFAGWLGRIASRTSDQARMREEIHKLVGEFHTWVDLIVQLVKAFAPLFSGPAVGVFTTLLGLVIGLVSAFTHLLQSMGSVGNLVLGGLGFAILLNRFSLLLPLVSGLAKAFGLLKGALAGSAGAEAAAGAGGLLGKLASKVGPKGLVTGAVVAGGQAAAGAASGLAGGILAAGGATAPETLGLSLALAAALAAAIHWRKQIGEVIGGALNDPIGTLKKVGVFILPVIAGPLGAVIGVALKWSSQLGSIAGDAGRSLVSAFKSAAGFIVGVVTTIFGAVVSVIKGAASGAADAGASVIHAVGSAISGAAHFVESAVSDIAGHVFGWFKAGLGDLASIGTAIAQGIADGISSGASIVANAATGLASGAVDTVKSLLGIHSPSTVFRAHGLNIAQGLADGITAGQSMVRAAAAALVPSLGPLGVGLGASLSASTNPSSLVKTSHLGALSRGPASALAAAAHHALGQPGNSTTLNVNVNQQNLSPADPRIQQQIAGTVSNVLKRAVLPVPPRIVVGR